MTLSTLNNQSLAPSHSFPPSLPLSPCLSLSLPPSLSLSLSLPLLGLLQSYSYTSSSPLPVVPRTMLIGWHVMRMVSSTPRLIVNSSFGDVLGRFDYREREREGGHGKEIISDIM